MAKHRNCEQCMFANPSNHNFCAQCGASLPPQIETSNRKWWMIGGVAFGGWILLCVAAAMTGAGSDRLAEGNSLLTDQSKASLKTATNTPAQNSSFTELTPARRLTAAKEVLKNSPSQYYFDAARTHLTAISHTAIEYKEAQRLLKDVSAGEIQLQRKRAPLLREQLKSEYKVFVAGINPHLNYIDAKVAATKGGYALWATHEFFTQYTFSAGDDGPQVSAWVDRNRQKLQEAGIVRVGVMGRGGYASWSYFDLK